MPILDFECRGSHPLCLISFEADHSVDFAMSTSRCGYQEFVTPAPLSAWLAFVPTLENDDFFVIRFHA